VKLLAHPRVLIIDDDVSLLGLLEALLTQAGCEVETIAGAEGFTPELMSLGRPSLVLLNPMLKGLGGGILRSVVGEFRRTSRRPVVVFGDLPAEVLQKKAQELGADACIPINQLLEDPSALVTTPAPPEPSRESQVDGMSANAILELELEPLRGAGAEVKPAPRPAKDPSRAAFGAQILAAIAEELDDVEIVEGIEHFDAALDVTGDANLCATSDGKIIGVFVPCATSPSVGASVDLTVYVPWGGSFTVVATVDWVRIRPTFGRRNPAGFAARFPALDAQQKAMLLRFVQIRTPFRDAQP
jgi:hypothetical protein